MDRALVAKVGAVVFAWALMVPALASAAARTETVAVASVVSDEAGAAMYIELPTVTSSLPLSGVPFSIADMAQVPVLPAAGAVRGYASSAFVGRGAAPRSATAPITGRAEPPPEALIRDGQVIASWYGPRFYGNKTACGQTYTPEILGVAHRILKCGTLITITSPRGVTLTVPVIDRGPFIAGRALDLSNATRLALLCSDLCRVHMKVVE